MVCLAAGWCLIGEKTAEAGRPCMRCWPLSRRGDKKLGESGDSGSEEKV